MTDLPFVGFYSEFNLTELLPPGWEGSFKLTWLEKPDLPRFNPANTFYWIPNPALQKAFTECLNREALPDWECSQQKIPNSGWIVLIRSNPDADHSIEFYKLEYTQDQPATTPEALEADDTILFHYTPPSLTIAWPAGKAAPYLTMPVPPPATPPSPAPAPTEEELPF